MEPSGSQLSGGLELPLSAVRSETLCSLSLCCAAPMLPLFAMSLLLSVLLPLSALKQLIQKGPQMDYNGHPLVTFPNESNPWWMVFEEAVTASGGKLSKPEILASTTDARYAREMGIPTLGFSPMMNTPILLHEHNEFLNEAVYLNGVKVYESIIRMLSLCSLCSQQI